MQTVGSDHWQCTYGRDDPGRIVTKMRGGTALTSTRRRVDSSAVSAFLPVVAVIPLWLLALAVVWLPLRVVWHISFVALALGYLAAVLLLFFRPIQVTILAPLLGARRPTRRERATLDIAWRSVLQANRLPAKRFVIAVLPIDELNAFACGGHLVVVTSYAIDTLPRDELSGVLAHELSHHLGSHTVALTIGHWLSLPVFVLARIGFFFQNVATAATRTFARRSSSLTVLGQLAATLLMAISWIFLSGLLLSNAIANVVGRNAELQADRRAVSMGFGRPLASALRRVINEHRGERPTTLRERLAATHPPARTRVAQIEALLRSRRAR
jgi:Zn-dependent protease with chaperone function